MKLVKVSSIFASLRCALVSSVSEDEETMLQVQQRSTVDDENCASGNCHPTINDGKWNLVFRQTNGFWFNKGQWSLNADDPTKDDFSILDRLEKLRRNGAFEFRLVWPGSGLENQTWSQTSNPVTAAPKTVEGYEAISAPHLDNRWGGLEHGGTYSLLDGSVNHGNWYYSVGSFQSWSRGIPGPATAVNQVELYVKAPTPDDLYPQKIAMSSPAPKPSIIFSSGRRNTAPSDADFENAVNSAVTDHPYCSSKNLPSLMDYSNQRTCGGPRTNVAFKIQVNFMVDEPGEWEFDFNVDFGWGGVVTFDGERSAEGYQSKDHWWSRDLNKPLPLDIKHRFDHGEHQMVVYGAEGCCDGTSNIRFKKPDDTEWKYLTTENLEVSNDIVEAPVVGR